MEVEKKQNDNKNKEKEKNDNTKKNNVKECGKGDEKSNTLN